MNIKDIALLKNNNISEDQITYYRAKTTTRRKNPQPIKVQLTDQLRHIIDMVRSGGNKPNEYILDWIKPGMTPKEQRRRIQQGIKKINKYLVELAKDIQIPPFTTYAARHSFATITRNSGAPAEFIQEALGHESLDTTKNYLAGFPDAVKKKWAESLTDFDN